MGLRARLITRRRWLWTMRVTFLLFAAVVGYALYIAAAQHRWLATALLAALLISTPCIAALVETGGFRG